jgi:hypothetical protein
MLLLDRLLSQLPRLDDFRMVRPKFCGHDCDFRIRARILLL